MKKVLVTGGGGFIGSYVVEELLRNNLEVMVMDHSGPGIYSHLQLPDDVELFLGDTRDETSVTEAVAHVDGVIHLAAVLGTQETIQNPRPSAVTNIIGSLNVLEACNQYDLPLVYAGVGNHWMREHGAGSYVISKTAVEDYIKMFNANRGSAFSVVRPVNAYGPRQTVAAPYGSSKVRKIIPSFTARALLGEDIEVYGDGTQISDCVHVYDVARTFVRALTFTEQSGPVANIEVGPIDSVTVNAIAELVRNEAFLLTERVSDLVHLPMRPGEVPNAVVKADTTIIRWLGDEYAPEQFISLETGIKDTVKWFHDEWLGEYLRTHGMSILR